MLVLGNSVCHSSEESLENNGHCDLTEEAFAADDWTRRVV